MKQAPTEMVINGRALKGEGTGQVFADCLRVGGHPDTAIEAIVNVQ